MCLLAGHPSEQFSAKLGHGPAGIVEFAGRTVHKAKGGILSCYVIFEFNEICCGFVELVKSVEKASSFSINH